jgi:hypothetical protein
MEGKVSGGGLKISAPPLNSGGYANITDPESTWQYYFFLFFVCKSFFFKV